MTQDALKLREKPAYGDPCNNCGMCCIAVQCPLSLATFGEQKICPALGMADEGNFGCRMAQDPRALLPEISEEMEPIMREYHALLIGAGIGCDGTTEDEDADPDKRRAMYAVAEANIASASPEARSLIEYVRGPSQ